ncbi:MAG: MBL fold metallo-hydrolase [Dehalococcoidales bacterium]|nr:MBL fold metallo-hydrolase [Dehalococcoidales bacterium]
MTQIADGIYQLKVPFANNPQGDINSYLLCGSKEYLLIDPGANTDTGFDSLQRQLAEIGLGFKDITRILITHCHIDHYGLAGRVKERSQAKIIAHSRAKDVIQTREPTREKGIPQREQWLKLNGAPSFEAEANHQHDPQLQKQTAEIAKLFVSMTTDITIEDNETISLGGLSLKVLWAPGHSPDHICLYEPSNKILFSGDHVLPGTIPQVSSESHSETNPLGDFISSLNRLKQLDVNLVLPAHEHQFSDLPARIEEVIQNFQQRSAKILALLNTEPKTAYQIASEIVWRPKAGGVKFQDLETWRKRMAISGALAHLKAMKFEGKVTTFFRDDIIYYRHN